MLLVRSLKRIKELRKTDKKAGGGVLNEAQSKVSIIALTKRIREMLAVQVSFALSHLALLLFLAVKQLA